MEKVGGQRTGWVFLWTRIRHGWCGGVSDVIDENMKVIADAAIVKYSREAFEKKVQTLVGERSEE